MTHILREILLRGEKMGSSLSNLRVNHGEHDEIVLGIDYLTCRFGPSANNSSSEDRDSTSEGKPASERKPAAEDTSWPKPPSDVFGCWHK